MRPVTGTGWGVGEGSGPHPTADPPDSTIGGLAEGAASPAGAPVGTARRGLTRRLVSSRKESKGVCAWGSTQENWRGAVSPWPYRVLVFTVTYPAEPGREGEAKKHSQVKKYRNRARYSAKRKVVFKSVPWNYIYSTHHCKPDFYPLTTDHKGMFCLSKLEACIGLNFRRILRDDLRLLLAEGQGSWQMLTLFRLQWPSQSHCAWQRLSTILIPYTDWNV